ncbi:MAG TPA: DUF448 domain-containing protein [Myxococcota bacterium]
MTKPTQPAQPQTTAPTAAPTKPARKRGAKKGKRRAALKLEEPHRMCIVCRASRPQHELLRFARSADGAVGFDLKNRVPGVGAWLCPSASCLNKALDPKHGAFARAFEAAVVFDAPALRAQVIAMLDGEVKNALGLLRRQGTLATGRDEVARRVDDLLAMGMASDLSDNTRHEMQERLPDLPQLVLPTMAEIGKATGMTERPAGVIGIPKRGGDGLVRAITRWQGVLT